MSHKTQARLRTLFAIPSAAVLVLGASQALASPPTASSTLDCATYCADYGMDCAIYPYSQWCTHCGGC